MTGKRLVDVAVAAAVLTACVSSPPAMAETPCGPLDQRAYAVFDALFLQRNNANVKQPLFVDRAAPAVPLISTGDMTSTIGTGARLLYGDYGSDDIGWEVGYLGVYGMYAKKVVGSPAGGLEFANQQFAAAAGFVDGDIASTTYSSSLNSIEANIVLHEYDGGYNRRSHRPWQRCRGYDGGHVDWLAGFRWAGVEESALMAMRSTNPAPQSTYGVDSSSNLFAAQVGIRGRMAFERWATEGWMKIGIAGTTLSQSQSMQDAGGPIPLRSPRGSDASGMGMIAEMNWSAIYRIDDVWGFRVGYNLIELTGLALAPDQWDFSTSQSTAAGTHINGTGSMFLCGGSLGLEARW